jgi:alkanesulfonate monooxygenase SsuD/methylene tetrahydromethanopterin reductase-like flavin-dependent oxidoreductase (luciferase family)
VTGASGGREQPPAAIGVTIQGPMRSLADIARRLERAGADSLWTGDYFQSALVRAAVLGAATSRTLVGTHVLQAFARSPLATALAAADLQELTNGRFILGLGSQFPVANRRWHGVTVERPVAALREYVAAIHALLSTPGDESVRFDGDQFRYVVPPFRGTTELPPPPVWIGGAGPATVQLAADIADGLAGHLLWTYSHVRDEVRPVLAARPLPLTVPRLVGSRAVPGAHHDLLRRLAHYLVTPGYEKLLARQGIDIDRGRLLAAVRGRDTGTISAIVGPYAGHWCIQDGAELARHRELAAAHGVDRLMLLVPADADAPARVAAHEQALADLLAAGHPAGPGPAG